MEEHLTHPDYPIYEPKKWNTNKFIQRSHNCYAYAMNYRNEKYAKDCKKYANKTKEEKKTLKKTLKKKWPAIITSFDSYGINQLCPYIRPQLGIYGGVGWKIWENLNKEKAETMLLKDNPTIQKLRKNGKCQYGYYRIFLYMWKQSTKNKKMGDYHFLKQDEDGTWSHKNGPSKVEKIKEKDPYEYIENQKQKNEENIKYKNIKYEICGYYAVPILRKKNMKNMIKKNKRRSKRKRRKRRKTHKSVA